MQFQFGHMNLYFEYLPLPNTGKTHFKHHVLYTEIDNPYEGPSASIK